jgi:DNA-binding beta-propeller fold protein YncE
VNTKRSRVAISSAAAFALAAAVLFLGRRAESGSGGTPPAKPTHSNTVAINPANPNEAWVVNQENDSVSVVNATTGAIVDANPDPTSWSIPVGVAPRRIAFTPNGSKAYVTNSRGNVPRDRNDLNFTGSEIYGTVSVIDPATKTVSLTIVAGLGVEPYGLAVAPNGKWAVVTNLRSASLSFLDTATDQVVATHTYVRNLNFLPPGLTVADVDTDGDGLADFDSPAGVAISADSTRIYVSHFKSPWISVLEASLDASGHLLGVALDHGISLDKHHPFTPSGDPISVNVLKSQGDPRWLEDLTISPDGTRLWVPHVLHNVNHDVNDPALNPAFANRVYPAVSIVDLTTETFEWGDPLQTDGSARIEYELSQTQPPDLPAEHVPFGEGLAGSGGLTPVLTGIDEPLLGGTTTIRIWNGLGGAPAFLVVGLKEASIPLAGGTLHVAPFIILMGPMMGTPGVAGAGKFSRSFAIPNDSALVGGSVYFQGLVMDLAAPSGFAIANALRTIVGDVADGIPASRFGHRVAHPSRVEFSQDGSVAYLLDRAGEQVMAFDNSGPVPVYRSVFPRRDVPANVAPFDLARAVGDTPSGFLVFDNPATADDDARIFVMNETSRSLGQLRANHAAATMVPALPSATDVVQTDQVTPLQLEGRELFADASRPLTAKNYNNSCEACHFEGNEDSSVWRRSVGPRSTPAMFGGAFATGFYAWKAIRINLGQFYTVAGVGENGGTADLSTQELEALTAWADTVPVPLNPNRINGAFSPLALLGRDLFFGKNDTGFNPDLRDSNCTNCHPNEDINVTPPAPLAYTVDQVPIVDPSQNATHQDVCFVAQENLVGNSSQNVNSGVNLDLDGNGVPDLDRNGDGVIDLESFVPLDPDTDLSFTIPGCTTTDPTDPNYPLKTYSRLAKNFGIPTKFGVFSSAPYFHDHVVKTLRALCDPQTQAAPWLGKVRNTQHDVRGQDVQVSLQSLLHGGPAQLQQDIDAIIAFIESL